MSSIRDDDEYSFDQFYFDPNTWSTMALPGDTDLTSFPAQDFAGFASLSQQLRSNQSMAQIELSETLSDLSGFLQPDEADPTTGEMRDDQRGPEVILLTD